MITPTCPKCRGVIAGEDINVASDVAFCRGCNVAHNLSSLARGTGIDPNVDLERPPKGTWRRAPGLGMTIGASHRSVGGAIGTLLFGAFWNGIVSIFVALTLASTLRHLGVATPGWLPDPKMNDGPVGIGMTIFLWIFLSPFIAIGLAMIGAFFSCLAGRTEVRIRDLEGETFWGVGPFGFKRKFRTDLVKDVRIDDRRWTDSDGDRRRNTHILIEFSEGESLKFGSSLREDRRQFVAAALRQAIVK